MRFRILGPPVEQICLVEGKHSDKFEKIFKKIEKALKYKGKLWDEFQLHTGRQIEGTKRVEALPTIVKPTDTPDSLQLTQDKKDPPLLFILRPKGAPLANTPSKVQDIPSQQGSVPNTPGEATPASTPRREATPGATDSNVVSPAPVTTPAAKSETTVPNPGASYFDRLTAIYTKYEPSKLSKVNGTLKRFAGREEEVIQQLVKLYGPEPVIETPASKVETPPKAAEPPQQQPAPRTPTPEKAAVPEESPHSEPQVSPPTSPASQGMDADTLTHTPRSTSLSSPTHETVNEAYTYHDRLRAIYTVHDPPKVSAVDGTLKKYKGKEEAVIRQLVKKYGSEPIIGVDVQLSHTDKAYRDRLTAIYQKYDPSKLHTVEGTLQKFKGKEEQVIKKLVERYGPEPVAAEERDVSEYRKKITEIIEQHDPENLHMVEPLLENFVGREGEIIKKLNEKYAIGEPKEEEEKPQEKQEQKPVEEVKKERTPPVTPVVSFVAASPLRSTESKPVEGIGSLHRRGPRLPAATAPNAVHQGHLYPRQGRERERPSGGRGHRTHLPCQRGGAPLRYGGAAGRRGPPPHHLTPSGETGTGVGVVPS
ncbi:hypothetical protein AGDE_14904 [Angomonas deanei]|uniref:Uncharacterized protein n=1 Tax=Angomonas deanei TaxID=59799 RepID=A0A7G2C3Y4_9TRYP|nr:hypothetical protein AGDE_14904 [Angomonas deanei]CAD2214235.1 hypothetical protein, conserved [Angomonas deanei]|eukprot:EPY20016.1 hypothetical protein AGDE_14904 [Angomonas deanei]